MHIGSQHGGFHKLIQKIICNQDELDLGISEPIWYSMSDGCLSSRCGICGEKLVTKKTSSEEEIKSLDVVEINLISVTNQHGSHHALNIWATAENFKIKISVV